MTSKVLRGATLLTAGQTLIAASSFIRNIIIARLISVEDYGIASLFAVAIAIAETLSYIGLDKYLIQAKSGHEEVVQSSAQLFTVTRGVASAAIILIFSGVFANLFDVPSLASAFACLAIAPFARGFVHLDIMRMQRELDFKPIIWADTIPQIFAVVFAAPLAIWLEDYRVMLWIIVGQAVLYTLVSHLVATRPYRISFDFSLFKEMLDFGWPLLVNSLLIFGIFQGDRAIIGAMLTKQELGWYSAVFALLLTPTLLVIRVFSTVLLPMLSKVVDDDERFQNQFRVTVQSSVVFGAAFAIFLNTGGPSMFLGLFGAKYEPALVVFAWIVLAMAVRVLRAGVTTVAISFADTRNAMFSNIVRSIALPLAIICVLHGYGLAGVALSALTGEVLGLFASVLLLQTKKKALNFRFILRNVSLMLVLVAAVGIMNEKYVIGTGPVIEIMTGTLLTLIVAFILLRSSPELYCAIRAAVGTLSSRPQPGKD